MTRITLTATTALIFLLLLPCASMSAQSSTGAITGVVTDQTKAVIPGILVRVTNLGVLQDTRTDEKGEFRFVVPQKKGYTLTAEFTAFFNNANVEITKIDVTGGERRIVAKLPLVLREVRIRAAVLGGDAPPPFWLVMAKVVEAPRPVLRGALSAINGFRLLTVPPYMATALGNAARGQAFRVGGPPVPSGIPQRDNSLLPPKAQLGTGLTPTPIISLSNALTDGSYVVFLPEGDYVVSLATDFATPVFFGINPLDMNPLPNATLTSRDVDLSAGVLRVGTGERPEILVTFAAPPVARK